MNGTFTFGCSTCGLRMGVGPIPMEACFRFARAFEITHAKQCDADLTRAEWSAIEAMTEPEP